MSMVDRKVWFAVATAAANVVSGCAPFESPTTTAAARAHPHAAELWSSKCGSCHVPVEPASRSREAIETALQRHRRRVRVSDRDWSELVDFLAETRTLAAGAPTTPPTPGTRPAQR